MDREKRRLIEAYRRSEAGPLENNLIDELVARRARPAGVPHSGRRCSGCRSGRSAAARQRRSTASAAPHGPSKAGGTLRVGITVWGGSLEPYLLNEGGSLAFAGIPAEYLTFTNPQGRVVPWLATSWKPNANATVWTFQLRKGVKFHNGKTMTARDVVASMRQYVSAKGSNAGLSPYFDAAGVTARGDYTVVFRLKSPIGVFPYLVSQTTYQAPIQLAATAAKPGTWVAGGMIGTGPFKVTKYVDKRSAELVRHDAYWGGRPPLDGVKITFYQGTAPLVLALRAGQIDLAMQLSPQEAQPFKRNPKYTYYQLPTSAHRQVCMRTDMAPFKDARVRRAVALAINRPEQVAKIMLGAGRGRQRQPVLEGIRLDRPVDQATHAEPRAREGAVEGGRGGEPEGQPHDVELPRPHGPRGVHPGVRARGGHRRGARGHGRRQVLRLRAGRGRLRHHDAVAEPPFTLTEYGARGVPNVYLTRATCRPGRRLERIALQATPSSTRWRRRTSRRRSSLHSGRRRSGWRAFSSATRRSSPTTSSTT